MCTASVGAKKNPPPQKGYVHPFPLSSPTRAVLKMDRSVCRVSLPQTVGAANPTSDLKTKVVCLRALQSLVLAKVKSRLFAVENVSLLCRQCEFRRSGSQSQFCQSAHFRNFEIGTSCEAQVLEDWRLSFPASHDVQMFATHTPPLILAGCSTDAASSPS